MDATMCMVFVQSPVDNTVTPFVWSNVHMDVEMEEGVAPCKVICFINIVLIIILVLHISVADVNILYFITK